MGSHPDLLVGLLSGLGALTCPRLFTCRTAAKGLKSNTCINTLVLANNNIHSMGASQIFKVCTQYCHVEHCKHMLQST